MATAPNDDRFLFWPTLIALGIPAIHIIIRTTPAGHDFAYVILGMPMLAMTWIGFGIAGIVALRRSIIIGAKRCALSWLPVCLIVGVGSLHLDTVRRYTNLTGDILHFAAKYPHYRTVIETLPDDGDPKLFVFNFGGMIWASSGIVYDESGEIEKPVTQQSEAWKRRADRTELGCGNYFYTPLIRHFYLADFPC